MRNIPFTLRPIAFIAILSGIAPLSLYAEARFSSLKGTVQVFENRKWVNATTQTKLASGTMI